jgi:hypothetical protein
MSTTPPPDDPDATVPSPSPYPAGPDSAEMANDTGGPPRKTGMIIALTVGATLLGVVALIVGLVLSTGDDDTASGEVFLEAAAESGPDPFTTDVDTDTPDPDALAVPAPVPTDVTGGANAITSENGDRAGLYGGTLDTGRCDPQQLVEFLDANPAKAQAWVDALNRDSTLRWSGGTTVSVSQIGDYVSELTPIILVTDTRVTNYGYKNGQPSARQAVLQRGTAVLVDAYGVPRTKCNCGNPLTAPTAVATGVTYTGPEWNTFDPSTIIVVQQTTVVIDVYVLVDVDLGGTFERPVGTTGDDDTDIDVGGVTPATEPPDTEPEPETTTSIETLTGARDYCEALQFYVDAVDEFDTDDEAAAIEFFENAITDLAALAPPEVKADWEYYRDVVLPALIAGQFPDDPRADAADERVSAHALSACGIATD